MMTKTCNYVKICVFLSQKSKNELKCPPTIVGEIFEMNFTQMTENAKIVHHGGQLTSLKWLKMHLKSIFCSKNHRNIGNIGGFPDFIGVYRRPIKI